jgi:peptidoglycan/LPS O-acetylase OafA/YrhL
LVHLPQTHDGSWSLTYEWLFYLLAATAFALSKLRSNLRYAGLGAVVAIAIALLCLLPRGLFFIPGIVIGMGWLPLQRIAPWLKYPFLGVFIFMLAWRGVDLNAAHPAAYSLADVFTGWPLLLTTISMFAALYAFAGICLDGPQTAWLRNGFMQQLGKISYSFYLWHPVVMFATKRITYAWVLPLAGSILAVIFFAVSSFVLAYAISSLSQQLLEVRVGKALRQWLKPKRVTSNVTTVAPLSTPQAGGT